MRPNRCRVSLFAVLGLGFVLALPLQARAGQDPAPPPKAPSPIGLRAYAIVDSNAVAAKESFDAVLGTSHLTAFGGGVDVVDIWKHLFARVAVTRARETGSRVFGAGGRAFPPGVPRTGVGGPPASGGAGGGGGRRPRRPPRSGAPLL